MSISKPGPAAGDRVRDDADALERAIDLATVNVSEGGGPFGALVAGGGRVVALGQNRVTRDNDPTAHAEVVAIRAACSALGTFSLAGYTLYASCEPCPLCLAASLWARLDRVVFAASRRDAARAGFDDEAFYHQFSQASSTWAHPVVAEHRIATSCEPFDAWLANAERTEY